MYDGFINTLFHVYTGTFCGVFRRQALDRGALLVGANKIVTGIIEGKKRVFFLCYWIPRAQTSRNFFLFCCD